MEGVLKFQLPEEREAFEQAQKGGSYLVFLQDFDNELRNRVKHGEKQVTNWEEVRDLFYRMLGESEIELWS